MIHESWGGRFWPLEFVNLKCARREGTRCHRTKLSERTPLDYWILTAVRSESRQPPLSASEVFLSCQVCRELLPLCFPMTL